MRSGRRSGSTMWSRKTTGSTGSSGRLGKDEPVVSPYPFQRSDFFQPLANSLVDAVSHLTEDLEPLRFVPGRLGWVREGPPQDLQRPGVELRAVGLIGIAEDDGEAVRGIRTAELPEPLRVVP